MIPPVVDPAQPPINIITIIIIVPKLPQLEKLLLLYPVPVKIDVILNNETLNDNKKSCDCFNESQIAVTNVTIIKIKKNFDLIIFNY